MSYEILTVLYFLKQILDHSQHKLTKYEQQQQRDFRSSLPRTTATPGPPLGPPLKQPSLEVFAYSHTMVSA